MALDTPTLTDRVKLNILEEFWHYSIIGLALVAQDGTILTANEMLCNLLEYNLSELQTKKYQDITYPDDLVADVTMANRVASGNEDGYVMKKRFISKTGRVIWVMLRVRSVKDEHGNFLMFLSQVSEMIDVKNQLFPDDSNNIYVESKRRMNYWDMLMKNWDKLIFAAMMLGALIYYIWEASTK